MRRLVARSLNKVQLIGNLTRDPELRYTPQGTAVCTFGLATNRAWTTDDGVKHEEAEFHRIVTWNKLAELCAQLLFKGRRIYVEGRLQTRQWTGSDGLQRKTTEIVTNDMILLDSRQAAGVVQAAAEAEVPVTAEKEVSEAGETTEVPEETVKVTAREIVGKVPSGAKPADDQKADDKEDKGKKKEKEESKDQGNPQEEDGGDSKAKEVKKEDIPF